MAKRSPTARRPKERASVDSRAVVALSLAMALPVASMFLLRAVVSALPESSLLGLRAATARIAAWSIGFLGIPNTLVGGTDLHLANHILRIDFACTAYDWLFLFLVAVVAVPVLRKHKLRALALGIPMILVANVIRLTVAAAVSEWSPARFALVHDVFLQLSMALLVAVLWVGFLWYSRDGWYPGWD